MPAEHALAPGVAVAAASEAGGRVAVVDIGSNSVRLVVYSGLQRSPLPVFNEKVLCGLGRGMDESGRLSPVGRNMAMATLHRFKVLIEAMEVARTFAVATAAVRDASDGAAFIAEIERETGMKTRVLSGREEAALSALGVHAAEPAASGLIGDLGGGSLELVRIDGDTVDEGITLPLGVLKLSGHADVGEVDRIIDATLDRADWLPEQNDRNLYVVGGAWRTIGRVHMRQHDHPLRILHGYAVAANDIADFCRVLQGLGPGSLSQLSGVSKGRLATLPLAARLMRKVVQRTGVGQVVFSAFGLREGVIYERLPDPVRAEDPLLAACRLVSGMTPRFGIDEHALLEWLDPLFRGETPYFRRLRQAAGLLSDIGWRVHPDYRGEHAAAEILRGPLVGLDHGERVRLALAVRARYTHSDMSGAAEPFRSLVDDSDIEWALRVGQGLRLAHTVAGGMANVLSKFRVELRAERVVLHCLPGAPEPGEEMVMSRLRRLAEAFGRTGLYLPAI
jgi:exopolyphosphatase/guanosine-5'-triphosphate,3'-diphosphate pyrophosphatase